jgi:hypothetical protein
MATAWAAKGTEQAPINLNSDPRPDRDCRAKADDACGRPDTQRSKSRSWSGLPSLLASGGLALVGAGLAAQQHQCRQHGQ